MEFTIAPQFEHVFDQAAACLLMQVSESGFNIAAVSNKYLALTSTRREDLLGKDPFEIFPDKEGDPNGAISTRNAILQAWRTRKAVIIPDYLYHIYSPASGRLEPRWWRSSFEPIFDDDGQVEYVLGTAVDQTDYHQTHQNLDKAEQMLHLAIQAADIGTWSIDVETKEIISSARSKELFGLQASGAHSLQTILCAIHQQYRQKVEDMLDEVMLSDGKKSFTTDYPVTGINDQQQRWVRCTAKLFFENGGNKPMVCGTLADITESKLLEQKQNDFISMVSHEMKTPLTAITSYLELLINKAKKTEDNFISTSLFKARAQTTKLKNLITGFLDMAGINDGELTLGRSWFCFGDLIREVADETKAFVTDHHIFFEDHQDVQVYADRAKVSQVIANLISNAVKYSAAGTAVSIAYITTPSHVRLTVSDQGIGIKPEHQQKLFGRFYRVDRSPKSKSGFGIGLYLAAEVIGAHNGSIGVISSPGEGSTFWFELPLEDSHG